MLLTGVFCVYSSIVGIPLCTASSGSLAHLVEQWIGNLKVMGSNLTWVTVFQFMVVGIFNEVGISRDKHNKTMFVNVNVLLKMNS